jgi:hypothetical protein
MRTFKAIRFFGILALVISAVMLIAGCNKDEVAVVGPDPLPTPDPCKCDHGVLVVRNAGSAIVNGWVRLYETHTVTVQHWVNGSGEILPESCGWSRAIAWPPITGGSCQLYGGAYESSRPFTCNQPTSSLSIFAEASIMGQKCTSRWDGFAGRDDTN